METYFTQITNYLLTQSWQIAVLVTIIAAISLSLKNKSAHVRYLLWLIVLAKCLVPPLFTVPLAVLPQEKLSEPVSVSPARIPVPFETVDVAEPLAPSSAPVAMSPAPTVIERPVRLTVRQWFVLAWIIGSAGFIIVAVTKALRTNFLLRWQRKPLTAELQNAIEDLFSGLGLKILPTVWLVDGIGQPFVWGLLRGDIYLPADFVKIDDAEHRRGVLGHELSHVLRFDAAVNLVQIVVQTVFWFHPLVWWTNRRIRAEREKCCDEMAIARFGTKPKDYSSAIINTLTNAYESTRPVPSLAIAGPVRNIEERIKTIMKPGRRFYKRPSLVAATVILLAALLTVPTALVLTARAGTETPDVAEDVPKPSKSVHEAALEGDIEQVKLLISQGTDVNAKNEAGWTPLHCAARYGHTDVVEWLLARGANVRARDALGWTPLHRATGSGAKYVPEMLVAKGADVKAKDKLGNTVIHHAAGVWHLKEGLLEFLVAKGADINSRNDNGGTPLHAAASFRKGQSTRAIDFLLANGTEVNAKNKDGITPLYLAAGNGRLKAVESLLDKGALIDVQTNEGMTALQRAVTRRQKGMAELLLNRGANVDAKESRGCTALHFAVGNGSNEIVELLAAKGADVNAKTIRGETPAHLGMLRNHKDTIELLRSKGAEISTIQLAAYVGDLAKVKSFIENDGNPNSQDGYGLTLLHAAAGSGQREIAELLISKGASVNAGVVEDGLGTPLHYATHAGSGEVAELLISNGALIDAKNKYGAKPLHLAAGEGYNSLVRLLLAKGSDVNAKDENGWTPLYYAASRGHKDVVLFLVENGSDIQAVSKRGTTPLYRAVQNGHEDIAKFLIDNGASVTWADGMLYNAVSNGQRDLAELLIKKGADVNSEAWGDAPSLYAVWSGRKADVRRYTDVLELLLAHGANPNAKDHWDWSLLHYTTLWGYADMTKLLLNKGANPNTTENDSGQMPLHMSAKQGHRAIVELLIDRGAGVNARDWDGSTALSLAKEKDHKEIVELLHKNGAKESN